MLLIDDFQSAAFSECGKYRWMLGRHWNSKAPRLLFIGVNPSVADKFKTDPTIRKVIEFAQLFGCGGFYVGNLHGFISPYPEVMRAAADSIGPDNDKWLRRMIDESVVILCAWGNHGTFLDRDLVVMQMIRDAGKIARCLGVNANGTAVHPLMQPYSATLRPYRGR